jgi:hypothetical protein
MASSSSGQMGSPAQGGSPVPGAAPGRQKRTVDVGIATIVSAGFTALALIAAAFLGGHAAASKLPPSPTAVSTVTPPHIPGLSFSLTYHQAVPWCIPILNGAGRIPNGYTLLIFDREVDSDNHAATNSYYSIDGPVVASGSSWSMSPIFVGPKAKVKHFYVELTGVLVTNATANFVTAISAKSWGTPVLPPALQATHAFVLRNNNISQC